ncbi:hypothetical protein G7062_04165 [Erysipelothrix sp. HDW6C]|uniref:hypothetical protein n=1 Tax=Erysipelothrix sp. HDW6C TaxID=2714930 RepID=UPI00140A28FF|nr:hypothetical protein [Erysipelothrix sp. HDW6C]QIK69539.1 hypothetical protein G7062_04165 [Erysipelothrix sp. HDW6C]
MIKKVIEIRIEDNSRIVVTNHLGVNIEIGLEKKQISAKDIYALLDFEEKSVTELSPAERLSDDKTSGPSNEIYRLFNYVYDLLASVIDEVEKFRIELGEHN